MTGGAPLGGAGGTEPGKVEVNVAFERALAFTRQVEDRCATETHPFEWGTQLLHPALPLVWSLNFARVEEPRRPIDAHALAAAVEGLSWPSEHSARRVVVEDAALGGALAPGFKSIDWEIEKLVFMALVREPPPVPDLGARRMSSAELARGVAAFWPDTGKPPDALEQIVASRGVVQRAVDVTIFGVMLDDEPASFCELFRNGPTAQVENVQTGDAFRRRGLATAVTLAAVHHARAAGADFVFLIADADDWPKEMYRKLGFEDIGVTYEFRRVPPDPE